ncbi:TetR/AcrR family transcriptional regulator [Cryptosporangium aurantiacum]|uniref:Transcriptional regulator, TetR family n=1 Tax=Cryptosporangium aurantiacum TaxID=134849 RepID=A0A1M7Q5M1_9ACTN|nr:TetR/AcrR family transcriptional regulator [Cryptosporangium aurantiacum]SHN25600.1 transcriptional regulator, TetR family [Cryptosporangium aurantiacum]
MSKSNPVVDRRERYREQTREEAKAVALRQLAESGTGGLSLNAIAREIGLSGPALYRYFANRDALLTALVLDGFTAVGDVLDQAAADAADEPPEARLRAVLGAFRAWSIAEPHRYQLLFGTPVPAYRAPDVTIAAAARMFTAVLRTMVDVAAERDRADPTRTPPAPTPLDEQLVLWYADSSVPPHLVRATVIGWSRLHGVLSLEIQGAFGPMRFDAGLLYASEVDTIIASL